MKRVFYQASAMFLLAVFAVTPIGAAEQSESLPTISFFPYTRNFTVSVNIENCKPKKSGERR